MTLYNTKSGEPPEKTYHMMYTCPTYCFCGNWMKK